jgi:DNA-binding MarR family transcriptional regulator
MMRTTPSRLSGADLRVDIVITMEPHGRATQNSRDRATSEIEVAVGDLFRIGRSWNKDVAARFQPELSPLAFGILRYVMQHPPVRSADIVTKFGLDKASVSRQIRTLRDSGLIDSTPDPSDGRAGLLVATEHAFRTYEKYREQTRAEYRTVLDDWSDEELEIFSRMLRRLSDSLP